MPKPHLKNTEFDKIKPEDICVDELGVDPAEANASMTVGAYLATILSNHTSTGLQAAEQIAKSLHVPLSDGDGKKSFTRRLRPGECVLARDPCITEVYYHRPSMNVIVALGENERIGIPVMKIRSGKYQNLEYGVADN